VVISKKNNVDAVHTYRSNLRDIHFIHLFEDSAVGIAAAYGLDDQGVRV
jgi:hypothetical protein